VTLSPVLTAETRACGALQALFDADPQLPHLTNVSLPKFCAKILLLLLVLVLLQAAMASPRRWLA
jgi:hypothetical protein